MLAAAGIIYLLPNRILGISALTEETPPTAISSAWRR
jgi:hypothetical protein